MIFSQRFIQNSRKLSLFFHNSINAVTSAVIARIIRPMGLAFMTALSTCCAAAAAYCARVMPLVAAVAAIWATLKATMAAVIPPSATAMAGRLLSRVCTIGTRSETRAAPISFTFVITGSTAAPSSAMDSRHDSFAAFAAITSAFVSLYASEAVPYVLASVSVISCCLSCSLVHLARDSLNASSLMPAQLRASASGPVTCPTLAVSFAASVSPSIGSESPKVANTPGSMSPVHFARSFSLSVNLARWLAVSTDWSYSPSMPTSSL